MIEAFRIAMAVMSCVIIWSALIEWKRNELHGVWCWYIVFSALGMIFDNLNKLI